ncbi:microtubule-associated RP EB family member 1C [Micractinium conductrix]|uniref:Microtubule-associated RP EB family member 1C n=1 Tax=Micractinium conductrix TaxID=554055 RepID=A0A2P6V5T7_9CHLO|nr:microtubule-associated RP EB family member 1C [Micractinium conductrix]|eukprot:PSC69446.1 microtubule-associated RP EB family member 1C [Micractinium conductrix]
MNRGMMSDNMFTGKAGILGWLNSALQLRLERIEDTCNGAVACQLMDCLHPGSINMRKVDFNLRNDYEFIANYKELQKAFDTMHVPRAFQATALSKGKLQDNIEFMQFFKGYWDEVTGGQEIEYDAIGARQACKSGDWKKFSLGDTGAGARGGATIPAVRRGPAPTAPRAAPVGKVPLARAPVGGKSASAAASRTSSASLEQVEAAQQEAEALREQNTELKLKVDTAERERDFYFEKLRDIEILCQAPELQAIPAIRIVEKILYAADSAEAKEAMAEAQREYGASFEQPAEDVAPAAEPVAAAE